MPTEADLNQFHAIKSCEESSASASRQRKAGNSYTHPAGNGCLRVSENGAVQRVPTILRSAGAGFQQMQEQTLSGKWLRRLQPPSETAAQAVSIPFVDIKHLSTASAAADGTSVCSCTTGSGSSSQRRQLLICLNVLILVVGLVNVELPFSAISCCRAYMTTEPWGVLGLAGAVTATHVLCGATGLTAGLQRRRSTARAVSLSASYAATALAACTSAAAYMGIMMTARHDDHGEITWRLLPGIYAFDVLMLVAAAVGAITSAVAFVYSVHSLHTGLSKLRRRQRRHRLRSSRQGGIDDAGYRSDYQCFS